MRARAFTLIELLIVVAIIAILAAIAVPNFLEAQTRAKISRVRADMRTEATAIEAYAVDENRYPPAWDYWPAGPGRTWGTFTEISAGPFHARVPSYLTTPIAYITSIPGDPFRQNDKGPIAINLLPVKDRHTYFNMRYFFDGGVNATGPNTITEAQKLAGAWFLYSPGPDRDEFNTPAGATATALRVYRDYDATNGTVSLGNLFRTPANGERLGSVPYFYTTP
ncbi:MAG: type II secretion system protein [Candidatus Sumerlaeaceae bacterium]